MTELHEQQLREQLRTFVSNRVDRHDRFADLFEARFPEEMSHLPDHVQELHLERIQVQLAERANEITPSWLQGVLRPHADRMPQAPRRWTLAVGFSAAAALFILLLLNLVGPTNSKTNIASVPDPAKSDPQKPNRPDLDIERKLAPQGIQTEKVADRKPGATDRQIRPDELKPNPLIAARIEIGKFGRVTGEPTYRLPGAVSTKALPKRPLYAGVTVETGDTDKAEVIFADGTMVALDFNTTLILPPGNRGKTVAPRPEEITVTSGRVWVVAVRAVDSAKFAIKTPVAMATVLGTTFSLSLERRNLLKGASPSNLRAVLEVQEGKVRFSNNFGSVFATGGTGSAATLDSRPSEPKRVAFFVGTPIGSPKTNIGYWINQSARLSEVDAIWKLVAPYGWSGFNGMMETSSFRGGIQQMPNGEIRITDLVPDSPARLAGLRVGDTVLALEGKPTRQAVDVNQSLLKAKGKRVRLTIQRNGQTLDFSFVPIQYPFITSWTGTPLGRPEKRLFEASWPIAIGETRLALSRLQVLAKEAPGPAVYNNLGVAYETMDDLGDAIRSYKKAVELDPSSVLYRYNLGTALRQVGNYSRSFEELEKVTHLEPATPGPAFGLIKAAYSAGQPDLMLKYLSECETKFDGYREYPIWAATVFARSGQLAKGLEFARRSVEVDPTFASTHHTLGLLLLESGLALEAEAVSRKSIELAPLYAHAHNSLGLALRAQGKLDEAIRSFDMSAELKPDYPGPHGNLMQIYFLKGSFEDALRECRITIRLNPGAAQYRTSLGEILFKMGRNEEAVAAYRKSIAIAPAEDLAYANLGDLLETQGKLDEADAVRKKGLKLTPKSARLLNSVAWSYAERGIKLDEALDFARRAIKAAPADAAILDTLGWVHYKRAEYADAEVQLKGTIELYGKDPNVAEVWVHLGAVYEKTKEIEKAKEAYRNALIIRPGYKEAVDALKRLGPPQN
jgi:tetratricopeptide (TPR) repeat protein